MNSLSKKCLIKQLHFAPPPLLAVPSLTPEPLLKTYDFEKRRQE